MDGQMSSLGVKNPRGAHPFATSGFGFIPSSGRNSVSPKRGIRSHKLTFGQTEKGRPEAAQALLSVLVRRFVSASQSGRDWQIGAVVKPPGGEQRKAQIRYQQSPRRCLHQKCLVTRQSDRIREIGRWLRQRISCRRLRARWHSRRRRKRTEYRLIGRVLQQNRNSTLGMRCRWAQLRYRRSPKPGLLRRRSIHAYFNSTAWQSTLPLPLENHVPS